MDWLLPPRPVLLPPVLLHRLCFLPARLCT